MLKLNPDYALYQIADASYLLPFGQGIADHRRGIKLNEAGAFLWQQMHDFSCLERMELLKKLLQHYEVPEDAPEAEPFSDDLELFLEQLAALDILRITASHDTPFCTAPASEPPMPSSYMQIGPLCLCLTGPSEVFPEEFVPFQTVPCQAPDLTVALKTNAPKTPGTATLLIRNEELFVLEYPTCYQLLFPNSSQLIQAHITKDGKHACIYYKAPVTDSLLYDIFHAVRFLFLYTAKLHGCYALHSASILYKGQAWLFSGRSGMGKSTHTALWHELYDTPLINGDLNLLALCENKPVIYGIPWCGTSGIYDTKTYPLGGIVLLKQAGHDVCLPLSRDKQALLVCQRMISPSWTAAMFSENLDFALQLSDKIAVCTLECTKNPSAAKAMKSWIDLYAES